MKQLQTKSRLKNRIVAGILSGMSVLAVPLVSEAKIEWVCDQDKWLSPPSVEDGLYHSTMATECRMKGGSPDSMKLVSELIRSDIETSGKLRIHTGPTSITYQGLPALKYDVTDDLKAEGSPASIRQDLIFATDEKTRLIYSVKSTEVDGKGLASYLKKVDFLAEIEPLEDRPGHLRFKMINTVEVQRPWFALALVFQPIAKSTAEEKFTKAKDRLLDYLKPSLESAASASAQAATGRTQASTQNPKTAN